MSEQVDIAKEWLSEFCKSSQDGEVCAFTIKKYLEQLEAERDELIVKNMLLRGSVVRLEFDKKRIEWLEKFIQVDDPKTDWGTLSLDYSVEGRGRYGIFAGTRLGVGSTLRNAIDAAKEQ